MAHLRPLNRPADFGRVVGAVRGRPLSFVRSVSLQDEARALNPNTVRSYGFGSRPLKDFAGPKREDRPVPRASHRRPRHLPFVERTLRVRAGGRDRVERAPDAEDCDRLAVGDDSNRPTLLRRDGIDQPERRGHRRTAPGRGRRATASPYRTPGRVSPPAPCERSEILGGLPRRWRAPPGDRGKAKGNRSCPPLRGRKGLENFPVARPRATELTAFSCSDNRMYRTWCPGQPTKRGI